MQPPNMQNKGKQVSFFARRNRLLSVLLLGIVLALVCLLTTLPQINAFFSDLTQGTDNISASQLAVEVISMKTNQIIYRQGAEKVEGDEITAYNGFQTDVLLSDGYMMTLEFVMSNTSKVEEDLTPQFYFEWEGGSSGILEAKDVLYIYPYSMSDAEIHADTTRELAINTVDADTGLFTDTRPGATQTVAAGKVSSAVRYKILFARTTDITANPTKYRKTLIINPAAKATFPKNIAPNWYASDVKKIKAWTQAYSNPFVGGFYTGPDLPRPFKLSSDNINESSNSITAFTDTESATAVGRFPNHYTIERLSTQGQVLKTYENVDPIGKEFTDTEIPFMTDVQYRITSYDDYNNIIGSRHNELSACNGGFIKMEDSILRDGIKPLLDTPLELGNSNPITVNNFVKYGGDISLKEKGITSLEGLQHLKGAIGGLYLDSNNFTTIAGKLPNIYVFQLSLSGNTFPQSELSELAYYKDNLSNLYLNNIGLNDITLITNINFKELRLIGINSNQLTDISSLNKFTKLGHIDASKNTLLKNVNNMLGYVTSQNAVELPELYYYNLDFCPLDAASVAYLTNTSNFYDGCRVVVNGNSYYGTRPKPPTS